MIAIKNVRLIDGTGRGPRENTTILIENGMIQAVGEMMDIPENASVLGAEGYTAIPGLIDMHTHFGGSSVPDYPDCGNRIETYDFLWAREEFLKWGVTTVRTCGDQVDSILPFRDEANAGRIRSPRIISCGPFFQIMNGHPWGTVYNKSEVVGEKAVEFVDLHEPIEDQVDRVASLGADFIKTFYPEAASKEDPAAAPRMTFEQLKRVIDRAHMHGLLCACHIDGPEGMVAAAAAGADTIEHAVNLTCRDTELTDEMAALVKSSGAVVDPTMIASIRLSDMIPDGERIRKGLEGNVQKLYQFGVPLAVGCDSGIPMVPFGESLHDEMGCLARVGIPPIEIIKMATFGNAGILGLSDRLGSIEQGKEADLILLGSDPLERIENTKDIRLVMQRGAIVTDKMGW